MPQFSLPAMQDVKINSVNIRAEMNGDEHIPAVDIGLTMQASNVVLSEFHQALRGMLYRATEEADKDQQDLDGVEPVTDMPALRCGIIEMPIKLATEYEGYTLTIDRGLGGKSNVVIGGCRVNNFKVSCMDGGTVVLSFRVQASGVNADVLGKLGTLVQIETKIQLLAPEQEPEAQQAIPGAGDKPARGGKKKDQPAGDNGATEAFMQQHGA